MLIRSRENREGGERNGRLIKLTYKNVLTIFLSGEVQEYYVRDKILNETRIESKKIVEKYTIKKKSDPYQRIGEELNLLKISKFSRMRHTTFYRIFLRVSGENAERYKQDSSSNHIFIPA